MTQKILHSILWIGGLLMLYLTSRTDAHNRPEEPPLHAADTVQWVSSLEAMTGSEWVDTSANHLAGNIETLYPLFDRLFRLEQWYDQWGRSGVEPFPGGAAIPDSLLTDETEELLSSETEESIPEETHSDSAVDRPQPNSNDTGSDGTASPTNAENRSSATISEPRSSGNSSSVLAGSAAEKRNSTIPLLPHPEPLETPEGIFPRPQNAPGSHEPYPFDPLREVVSILHIGDSHIQGGFYPRQLRVRLQYRFGNAGRGLLTPYRLMKTNQPAGYEISSPQEWLANRCTELHPLLEVGATGAAIATTENHFELTIATPGDPFQQITVFHHMRAPLLTAGENACEIGCPWEDTPTMTHIPLREPTERVVLRGDVRDTLYNIPVFCGFMLENGRSGLLYHSVGINGNTFTALARQPQIIREAAQLEPDLIILSLGTNDAYGRFDSLRFTAQLERVIDLCHQYAPQSPLLLTTPMECFSRMRFRGRVIRRLNPNAVRVRDAILEVARQQSLPYWDFYAAAGGEGAMERWNQHGLARADKIHLTPEGYLLQGEMLYQALCQAYEQYKRSLLRTTNTHSDQ